VVVKKSAKIQKILIKKQKVINIIFVNFTNFCIIFVIQKQSKTNIMKTNFEFNDKELRNYISNYFSYSDLTNSISYYINSYDFNFLEEKLKEKNYDELLDLLIILTNFYEEDIIKVLLENSDDIDIDVFNDFF